MDTGLSYEKEYLYEKSYWLCMNTEYRIIVTFLCGIIEKSVNRNEKNHEDS